MQIPMRISQYKCNACKAMEFCVHLELVRVAGQGEWGMNVIELYIGIDN